MYVWLGYIIYEDEEHNIEILITKCALGRRKLPVVPPGLLRRDGFQAKPKGVDVNGQIPTVM